MRIMSPLLAAALCAAVPAAASPSSSASAKPKVVVSLPPLHSLVSRMLQGVAEPELLMDQRLDTRLVDLNGRQVEALRRADLMIWSGPVRQDDGRRPSGPCHLCRRQAGTPRPLGGFVGLIPVARS